MDLHIKYRPKTFDEVIGQDDIVKSLKGLFDAKSFPHAVLLSGNSGTGKTTIARIIATNLGCLPSNLIEMDGGTAAGVDDTRELVEFSRYSGIGTSPIKVLIVDEVQNLSKKAWDALLKTIEQPPAFIYFVFCTTELEKIPTTIKTRCHRFNLAPVKEADIYPLLEVINELEGFNLSPETLVTINKFSEGSPRNTLVNLSKCRECKTPDEAKQLLLTNQEFPQIEAFLKLISKRTTTWEQVKPYLAQLKGADMEALRRQIFGWMNGCLTAEWTKDERDILFYIKALDVFSQPIYTNHIGYITLALGRLFYT